MSKDILVYIEVRNNVVQQVSYELVGQARRLAKFHGGKVVGLAIGDINDTTVETLKNCGLDELAVASSPLLAQYKALEYTEIFVGFEKERNFDIALIGATYIGRDLAPRCSARLHTGLTADCTGLEMDEESGHLLMTRPSFGGNLMATILCEEHRPQMATVRPGVMMVTEERPATTVTRLDMSGLKEDTRLIVEKFVEEHSDKVDLGAQKILIAGGRGIGSKENFQLLHDIAKELGGEVAASRAAVDDGFAPKERQVGQTGVSVKPNLYIACGISGAIQHLAGCENSLYLVAINKDPDAPILKVADLGIVGDYKVVLPQLKDALLAKK